MLTYASFSGGELTLLPAPTSPRSFWRDMRRREAEYLESRRWRDSIDPDEPPRPMPLRPDGQSARREALTPYMRLEERHPNHRDFGEEELAEVAAANERDWQAVCEFLRGKLPLHSGIHTVVDEQGLPFPMHVRIATSGLPVAETTRPRYEPPAPLNRPCSYMCHSPEAVHCMPGVCRATPEAARRYVPGTKVLLEFACRYAAETLRELGFEA